MCVSVTWIRYIFYITSFLWPDSLYPVLIFIPEEKDFLYPFRNFSCYVILFSLLFCGFVSVTVFQLPCSIGKFVNFVFSILPSKFQVHCSFSCLSQCTFLLSMWFILRSPHDVGILCFHFCTFIMILNVCCFLVPWNYNFLWCYLIGMYCAKITNRWYDVLLSITRKKTTNIIQVFLFDFLHGFAKSFSKSFGTSLIKPAWRA